MRIGHKISVEKFKGKTFWRPILEGKNYIRMDLHEAE
jgi:hypothetical protein